MKLHPWHEVSIGDNVPESVTGIIEIPKNHRAKYELDKASGMLKLDRVLYSSINYPANYGFIPKTYCDDDDPLSTNLTNDADCDGILTDADLFLAEYANLTGASNPGTKRLYEFVLGFVNAFNALACLMMPPM